MIFLEQLNHLDLTGPLDLYHESFDALPAARKKELREQTLDALANRLFEQNEIVRIRTEAMAQIRQTRRDALANELADRINTLTRQNLETIEGRLTFFHALGGNINIYSKSLGAAVAAPADLARLLHNAQVHNASAFIVSSGAFVCFSGKPDETARIASKWQFPETLTAIDGNGIEHQFYAADGNSIRQLAFVGPKYQFKFSAFIDANWTFSKVVIDPETGCLPLLPDTVCRILSVCYMDPERFSEHLENLSPTGDK